MVLGDGVAQELFDQIDPVSRKIRIGNQNYRVVGVAAKQGGGFGGPSVDDYVYVPIL